MANDMPTRDDLTPRPIGLVSRIKADNSENECTEASRLGGRIAAARRARGMNRNQLARELGTAWALVDRWEKGRALPRVESLKRVAEVLHVSVDELLGSEGNVVSIPSPELAEFQEVYAPGDLTLDEIRWLESTPDSSSRFDAQDYADLLHWYRKRCAQKASVTVRGGGPGGGL